jgi:4-amino-4-deoxy-L-arabinose transferase-like glycosyltransferase
MLSHLIGWLLLLALPMILSILIVALKGTGYSNLRRHTSALMIGGAWILPPLAFYSAIYYLKPTYQLIYLPCLLIPIAWVLYGKAHIFTKLSANLILFGLVIMQLAIFFLPIPQIPQAIHRQTEAYIIQQDHAWEQLIRELDILPKKNTLLIWVTHPSLTVYAVRLLDRETPIAVANPNRTRINYLDPKTMNWLPASDADTMVDEKYDGVIVIDELAGKAVVKYIPLANRQHRKVEYLLKPIL